MLIHLKSLTLIYFDLRKIICIEWMDSLVREWMDTWIIFILYQYLGNWFIVILIPTAKPHFLPIKKSVGTQNMIKKEIPFWINWGMDGIFLGYFLFGFFNAGELQFWFYILNSFFFLRGSNCCGVSRFLSFLGSRENAHMYPFWK